MPRVYLNDKEAAAVIVILESFRIAHPCSCTAEMVNKVPDRIRVCLEKQGKKKDATRKDSVDHK